MPSPVTALTGCSAWKSPSVAASFICEAMCPDFSRSTLLTTMITGTPSENTRRATNLSPAPIRSRALTTSSTTSTSLAIVSSTRPCIRSVSVSIGFCQPGRSTSTSCASSVVCTPRIWWRVVCGLSETIATFVPVSAFTSVDLPTFGRPATATKPDFMVRERRPRRRLRSRLRRAYAGGQLPRVGEQLGGGGRCDRTVGAAVGRPPARATRRATAGSRRTATR